MSSIVGVSHEQVNEENGLSIVKVVVSFLHVLFDFLMVEGDALHHTIESNGRSTTCAEAKRVVHKTARRSKRRKMKKGGGTHRRKCKKRRNRGRDSKTSARTRMSDLGKILLTFYHHISCRLYFKQTKREQDILGCKPRMNNEPVSNEEFTTDSVAICRGKTVLRNKKPPFNVDCQPDSGIASLASTSASNTKNDTSVRPAVNAITSDAPHRVNKDEKKFVYSSAQGTQCIPSDSEQVTLPSQLTPNTFKEEQTYIPPQSVEEGPPIREPVKLFFSSLGDDCSPWDDGLPPFKSVGEAMEHHPLSYEFQLDNPPLHAHCVDQQPVFDHQHGEKSEMVVAPLSIPPAHYPPFQEVPTEQAPVPDLQCEHEHFSNSAEQLDAIGETLPSPMKVFPWHPPGF